MCRLGDPADFGEGARQGSRLIADLERAHDAGCLEVAQFQRAGQADRIGPVIADQAKIDGALPRLLKGP